MLKAKKGEKMELSQDEKDRIVAEEKFRFETLKSLNAQEGGKSCGWHGHKCWHSMTGCHCGGFLKGLILGLILYGLFSFFCHHGYYGYHDGRCYYGAPMMQHSEPQDGLQK